MTQKEFDVGFKLLKRFLKENNIYNSFLKITAHNNPSFKKELLRNFNSLHYFKTWNDFFKYTNGIGNDFHKYGEGKAMEFIEKWEKFMDKHHFDGLKYY